MGRTYQDVVGRYLIKKWERESGMNEGWKQAGITPTPGERYEFEDFAGGRFVATLAAWMEIPMDDRSVGVRLVFDDREPFETNLPIRFRDAR